MIELLRHSDLSRAGDVVERYLAGQSSASGYWPDDQEVRIELFELAAYRRLTRGRLRMILEAVEDYLRGWGPGERGFCEERVTRGKLAVEHVMPRKWHPHWPQDTADGEERRDSIIHTLGNLTLLTRKLNSKVSNGPWLGNGGKREALEAHSVLQLNRNLLKKAGAQWADEGISARTQEIINIILAIWPVPPGHQSGPSSDAPPRIRRRITLSDLIAGGALQPGMRLYPRRRKAIDWVATLLPDGRVDVDGAVFSSPSEAASKVTGVPVNGWWFLLVDESSRRSLSAVRRDYINAMAVDAEDDEPDDDPDEDDS